MNKLTLFKLVSWFISLNFNSCTQRKTFQPQQHEIHCFLALLWILNIDTICDICFQTTDKYCRLFIYIIFQNKWNTKMRKKVLYFWWIKVFKNFSRWMVGFYKPVLYSGINFHSKILITEANVHTTNRPV